MLPVSLFGAGRFTFKLQVNSKLDCQKVYPFIFIKFWREVGMFAVSFVWCWAFHIHSR